MANAEFQLRDYPGLHLPRSERRDRARSGDSKMVIDYPANAVLTYTKLFIEVPYRVKSGGTAPVGINRNGLYDIIRRLIIDDSTTQTPIVDVDAMAIRKHFRRIGQMELPEPVLDLTADGTWKKAQVMVVIPHASWRSSADVFSSGLSTFLKKAQLELNWESQGDGVVFGTVNDFEIDEANVKVRTHFDVHLPSEGSPLITKPWEFYVRGFKTEHYNISTDQKDVVHEINPGLGYMYSHIAGVTVKDKRTQVNDAILDDWELVSFADRAGGIEKPLQVHSWEELKLATAEAHRATDFASLENGYRTFPHVADDRFGQAKDVTVRGDRYLQFDNVRKIAGEDLVTLHITDEFLMGQDIAPVVGR